VCVNRQRVRVEVCVVAGLPGDVDRPPDPLGAEANRHPIVDRPATASTRGPDAYTSISGQRSPERISQPARVGIAQLHNRHVVREAPGASDSSATSSPRSYPVGGQRSVREKSCSPRNSADGRRRRSSCSLARMRFAPSLKLARVVDQAMMTTANASYR
jgi:hypothetical protein